MNTLSTLTDTDVPVVTVECPMCHWRVPEAEVTSCLGRRVCVGCASTWFDDDESEGEDTH